MQLQEDRSSTGYRIWYTTDDDKLYAASYASYGGQEYFLEEVYSS